MRQNVRRDEPAGRSDGAEGADGPVTGGSGGGGHRSTPPDVTGAVQARSQATVCP